MASITSSSRLPEPEEFDYSVSHRAVPVPAVAYASTAPGNSPESGDRPLRQRKQSDAGSAHADGRRRGSFSFLRRNSNHSHPLPQQEQTPVPPVPATHIAQAHIEAAAAAALEAQKGGHQRIGNHTRVFSASSTASTRRKSSTEGARMLRKSSKQRQQREEQERLAREAAAIPKQPPRLQSINPLPNIGTFGGDDARPDSYAIFNGTAHVQGGAANFSRPGHAAAMPGYHNSSSSPAYVARSGNAFQGASSSPSVAGKSINGEYVDNTFDRTESMTHRGRYSYASSTANVNVNSPRRVRRRKDPTPFNVLVIGAKNCGKTSFITFLRQSLALPAHKKAFAADEESSTQINASKSSFTSHYLETEKDGERVGLTLWDSAGLEKHIIDLQLREMAAFVESKFEETFVEEQKVMRSPGAKDTHIHCVFLILDPVRLDSTYAASASQKSASTLAGVGSPDDDLDLQIMRALWGKTTVIPVIAKADTLTVGHMNFLKRKVWDSMKIAKLDPLELLDLEGEEEDDDDDALNEEDEDEDKVVNNLEDPSDSDSDAPAPKPKRNGHNRQSSLAGTVSSTGGEELPYIPMSILSPDPYELPPFTKVSKHSKIGRRFPWGFADPYDPEHCDFVRLRDSIFSEWRADLRELARTKWYENWRTSRLKNLPGSRQRVKGGVTPVAAVPREGRTSPSASRNVSSSQLGGTTTASIPRSVSSSTAQTSGVGMAIGSSSGPGKPERMMGIGSDAGSLSSRGAATYRSSEAAH